MDNDFSTLADFSNPPVSPSDQVRTVVKVSSPADILGVIPHRLGFHPTESLVVINLHGPRRRDELVMRFDLPPPRHDRELADDVVGRLLDRGADAAVLACYTGLGAPRSGLVRAPLFRVLRRQLRRAGVEVVDALLVNGGRWWSYLCQDERCCPPEGTEIRTELTGAAGLYAAESVRAGSVLLADRAALEASVEACAVPDPDRVDRAIERVVALLCSGGEPARGPCLDDDGDDKGEDGLAETEALSQAVELQAERMLARWTGGGGVDTDDALFVAVGMQSIVTRDRVLGLLAEHDSGMLTGMFAQIVRLTPDEHAAPVCAGLAWFAYGSGDGALAGVAAERALRVDPTYNLARLVLVGMSAMAPPSALREVSVAVRAEMDA